MSVNEKYPDIREACKKIDKLDMFISNNKDALEENFFEYYLMPLSFTSTDFWRYLLDTTIVVTDR